MLNNQCLNLLWYNYDEGMSREQCERTAVVLVWFQLWHEVADNYLIEDKRNGKVQKADIRWNHR